jgi:hypothetical protein
MLRRKWSHLPIVKRIIFMQVYVHSFRKFPHINLLFNSVSNFNPELLTALYLKISVHKPQNMLIKCIRISLLSIYILIAQTTKQHAIDYTVVVLTMLND